LKGHGFSRAAERAKESGALAPEENLENGQQLVMKQLLVFGFEIEMGDPVLVCVKDR
jgi:hypothetical protein